jgi:ParB family chromosome partitioning protein
VALGALTEDPLNAREFYSVEELDDMGQSLVKHGQHAAISAYEREGRLWVFDGVKRLKAARSAGIPTLRVEIAPPPASEIDVYLTSRRMNLERSTQTAIDDAIRWQELLTRQIVSNQQALASMVERSESYVSQVLSINRIPRSVLSHMKERPGTTEQLIAYKISGIFKPDHINAHGEEALALMAKSMVDEISAKGLNRSEVDRLIERRLGAPRARAKSDHQKLRCFGKEGLLKLFPSKGKVEFSISGLNVAQLNQVQDHILQIVQIADQAQATATSP